MYDTVVHYMNQIPMVYEILYSLIVVIVAYLFNKLIIKRSISRMGRKLKLSKHNMKPLKKVSSTVIYIVAIIIILGIFGLRGSLTGLLAGAGVIGIVIGMATQDVLSGVISGIVLFLDKPFKIGDRVKIGDMEGDVTDLTLQRTEIKTLDGETLTIPNSSVANDTIINRTDTSQSRLRISIGIDYDSDMDKAFETCQEVFKSNDLILEEPSPRVFTKEFADSSINLELKFWIDWKELQRNDKSPKVLKSEIRNEMISKFREAGIDIPYPHMQILKNK